MSQDWILDVLADLRSFAMQNRMASLAEQLDDTMLVAASELAQKASDGHVADGNGTGTGPVFGRSASGEIA